MTTGAAVSGNAPAQLDANGIAARIPHAGRMCLLDRLLRWDAQTVHCSATGHRAYDHPLRSASGLLAPCAVEYAAQAMALHGALLAPPDGAPRAGYIAALRDVRFGVPVLDDIDGELQVHAERLAGDADLVSYRFHVDAQDGRVLAEGRATVLLNPSRSGT
jgi:predicted hotdog family 3-hydroxylacyl-ACP dehydratase